MTTHQLSRRDTLRLAGVGITATALAGVGFGTGVFNAGSAHATPRIVPRSEWGFDEWRKGKEPLPVAPQERNNFTVHWQGDKKSILDRSADDGPKMPLDMHKRAKGPLGEFGPGIEYNFVISQRGEIFEGRGWDLKGGAVQGHNSACLSVQVHIRKGDVPSREALDSLRWLYFETVRHLSGQISRALLINGHCDVPDNSTECPGPDLIRWVREQGPGMREEAQREINRTNGPAQPEPEQPQGPPPFPGENAFRIGQEHPAVLQLDDALIKKGYTRHHSGASYQRGPMFSEATRLNVRDFQLAQGWSGSDADGYPGPQTWDRLMA